MTEILSLQQHAQLPLILITDNDDRILAQTPQATWFPIMRDLDWRAYKEIAVRYYEGLYRFNASAASRPDAAAQPVNDESKEQARLRLLFDRPTMGNEIAPLLFEVPQSAQEILHVNADEIAPGKAPTRIAGRAAKDFFSLLKAFVGMVIMGRDPEPDEVHHHLTNNPAFARACGFTPPNPDGSYRQTDIPSLRKLEQFDQIMTDAGLWNQLKLDEVERSVKSGAIKPEKILVHDTTHYYAYSSFQVMEYKDEKGKVHKKSVAHVTKRCGCEHKQLCLHPWVYTDDGAGTVVKSSGRMSWSHKASALTLAGQGIVIDAYAVADAASHDSKTIEASIDRLRQTQPWLKDWFEVLLDDGAADDADLKERLLRNQNLRLVCSSNPRGRKPITDDLPRGVAKITPNGEPVCLADNAFDYLGVRWDTEVFNFGPPRDTDGAAACPTCPLKDQCCPDAKEGRHITIPFALLPFINPEDPPLAKRYKAMLAKRTTIERLFKMLKWDLGTDQLTKRGNAAFQARLDKTLIAYQILLRTTA